MMIGLATDGGSTMTGRRKGLTVRQKEVPGLLAIHCVAHLLQLAIKDAAKKLQLTGKFNETLKQLATAMCSILK